MITTNYPAVVHAPHYEVLIRDRRGWPEQTNQRLYRSLADAQRAVEYLPLPGDFGARIVTYDVAYYARCGVCGDFVESGEWIFADWLVLVLVVAASPGWSCTTEQLVFCPQHRPDSED
ncbi:hypothetical protein [Amycolatopsis vancoresmycina]|uniref:Uncharacterized protein n=1 Tax=Amycolatopsis vancoresmycina DSM 44592 TaxID=1292037 RepID=R1I3F4_9PSEU|nr:hypothetical protein [Amycolatopsis vancoresmycina]EOD70340.1 hypothetical protein H480_01452 [Amycolatopsis vancoresmycina DSM 44592]